MKCVIVDYFKVTLYKMSAFPDSLKLFSFKIHAQVLSLLEFKELLFF